MFHPEGELCGGKMVLSIRQSGITIFLVKTISLKIDYHLDAWLQKQSKKLGKSKSAITRDALERTRRQKSGASCHDLMQEACGSFHSGVKDLATNKRHMRGFGEWKR